MDLNVKFWLHLFASFFIHNSITALVAVGKHFQVLQQPSGKGSALLYCAKPAGTVKVQQRLIGDVRAKNDATVAT